MTRKSCSCAMAALVVMGLAGTLRAAEPLLTMEEIRKLVEAGQYKDAQKPIARALGLQGPPAAGYDRIALLMLRAECQIQTKDSPGAIASAEQARKEAVAEKRFDEVAAPVALAALLQKSPSFKYTPKGGGGGGGEGIPVQDQTLRKAAYAQMLLDELPAAKQKVDALNAAKTIAPVLETAKTVAVVRALDLVTHPDSGGGGAKVLQTAPLTVQVTSNADRLFSAAVADMEKQTATIKTTANQLVNDTVGVYDPISKKSWLQPRTRRRGITADEARTLRNTISSCEKIHAACAELAATMFADFEAYQAIVNKALLAKANAGALLAEDYLKVP